MAVQWWWRGDMTVGVVVKVEGWKVVCGCVSGGGGSSGGGSGKAVMVEAVVKVVVLVMRRW